MTSASWIPASQTRFLASLARIVILAAIAAAVSERGASAAAPPGNEESAPARTEALLPGDLVRVEIAGLELSAFEVRVPAEGTIGVPGVGRFACAGKTIAAIESAITAAVMESGFVGSPGVAVNVVAYAPRRIYLLQGVRLPGAYELPMGEPLRLTQALALAGGLSPGARRDDVRVYRERGDGASPSMIRFDLSEITERGRIENDIRLRPGDTVVLADEASPDAWIWVGGAVRTPGRYPWLEKDGTTVLRAIITAGGFAANAETSSVRVLRTGEEGPTILRVDLRSATAKEPSEDILLRAGDVVLVAGGVL